VEHRAGLDVSMKATAVYVIDDRGQEVGRATVALAEFLRRWAETLRAVGLRRYRSSAG